MANWTKGPSEGGHKRGHSKMEHYVPTAEVKKNASARRRQDDKSLIEEGKSQGNSSHRTCEVCKAQWPAYTTHEAISNYRRMAEKHPRKKCQDKQGEFGPEVSK